VPKVSVRVNESWLQGIVGPDYTLLDLLPKDLRLTGANKPCDLKGQCGARTAVVNGQAVRSGSAPFRSSPLIAARRPGDRLH